MFTKKEICRFVNGVAIMALSLVLFTPLYSVTDIPGTGFNAIKLSMVAGCLVLIHEIPNYEQQPKLKAVLIGAVISPFWLGLRFFVKRKLAPTSGEASE